MPGRPMASRAFSEGSEERLTVLDKKKWAAQLLAIAVHFRGGVQLNAPLRPGTHRSCACEVTGKQRKIPACKGVWGENNLMYVYLWK